LGTAIDVERDVTPDGMHLAKRLNYNDGCDPGNGLVGT
jgi:hypothetical protein